jgi:serine/threonine-protein kinase
MVPNTTSTEDRERLLDEVLGAYLRAAQAGRAPSREALLAEHPALADELVRFFADQDHVEQLAAPFRQIVPARPPLGIGCTLGDYEILEEIAHGGMGVVFKARQKSLNRLVALKVLRSGPAASPAEWRRFRVEAEAVAHLDHPHIVPIYEVGEHEGLPYFSMKFVEGGSLAVHKHLFPADPPAAARLVAQVARAVQHAHERGILHRDLKPANVLLQEETTNNTNDKNKEIQKRQPGTDGGGRGDISSSSIRVIRVIRGCPLVTDFGLAKRVGMGDAPTEPAAGGGPAPSSSTVTGAGTIVGTPAYMSPEQALGQPPTTATDVYGLGAILYELLTGRPPYRGADVCELLRQARQQELPPPRSLNPRVRRDLDAVCRACLQRDPRRRYGSARELAEDLERYLAGQPVHARPVGRVARFGRWCRRQPVVAGLLGGLLAVLVTGFVLVVALWRHAEANYQTAQEERERAEGNLARVEDLLDEVCSRLSEKHLAAHPGLQPVRKEFLEAGLRHYRAILAQRGDDPRLRADLAATHFRIGKLAGAIGSRAESLDAYNQALALYQELSDARPEDADLRLALGRTHARIAQGLGYTSRKADALESYGRARPLFESLRADPRVGDAARMELALVCENTGILHYTAARLREARACLGESVAVQEDFLKDRPGSFATRCNLARALDNLGNVLGMQGDKAAARRCFDRARHLLEELGSQGAENAGVQETLANVCIRIAGYQCVAREFDQALATLKEGHDLQTRLTRANPAVLPYQDQLASTLRQMGHAYRDSGRGKKALECYAEAAAIGDKLVRLDPGLSLYRRGLARSWFDTSTVYMQNKKYAEAAAALEKARDLFRTLAAAEPDNIDYHRSLGMALNNLTVVLTDSRPADALAAARESQVHGRAALALNPDLPNRQLLSAAYRMLAGLASRAGEHNEAAAAARARRDLWPDSAANLVSAAHDLALVANAAGPGRQALREACAAEAVQALARAVRLGFRDAGKLERDKELAGLSGREDYRKLLEQLKRPPASP